jgi:hypothetical protein
MPRERWAIFLVTPSTLLRWHRDLVRGRWNDPRALAQEVVQLAARLARENPRWGYLRIAGECRKPGVTV